MRDSEAELNGCWRCEREIFDAVVLRDTPCFSNSRFLNDVLFGN